MIPQCPVHKSEMRLSKDGVSYFCSKKNADGSYCLQKWKPEPSVAPASSNGDPALVLKIEALRFAASLYEGQGKAAEADAMQLAHAVVMEFGS